MDVRSGLAGAHPRLAGTLDPRCTHAGRRPAASGAAAATPLPGRGQGVQPAQRPPHCSATNLRLCCLPVPTGQQSGVYRDGRLHCHAALPRWAAPALVLSRARQGAAGPAGTCTGRRAGTRTPGRLPYRLLPPMRGPWPSAQCAYVRLWRWPRSDPRVCPRRHHGTYGRRNPACPLQRPPTQAT